MAVQMVLFIAAPGFHCEKQAEAVKTEKIKQAFFIDYLLITMSLKFIICFREEISTVISTGMVLLEPAV